MRDLLLFVVEVVVSKEWRLSVRHGLCVVLFFQTILANHLSRVFSSGFVARRETHAELWRSAMEVGRLSVGRIVLDKGVDASEAGDEQSEMLRTGQELLVPCHQSSSRNRLRKRLCRL